MKPFALILMLVLAAGCNAPTTVQPPVISVTAPVTVEPGAVVFTFPPGSIVVNVQIGSDKTPLVNVSVNGHVFGAALTTTAPTTQPKEMP
jgi:hypothetical protein